MNPQKTQKIIIIKANEYRVSYAYVCIRPWNWTYANIRNYASNVQSCRDHDSDHFIWTVRPHHCGRGSTSRIAHPNSAKLLGLWLLRDEDYPDAGGGVLTRMDISDFCKCNSNALFMWIVYRCVLIHIWWQGTEMWFTKREVDSLRIHVDEWARRVLGFAPATGGPIL